MLQTVLRDLVHRNCKRKASPSLGIIDFLSVKNRERGIPDKGVDGKKKINGRKWHLVLDVLGLLMCVVVTEANIHDSVAAEQVVQRIEGRFPRLKRTLPMGCYQGEQVSALVETRLGSELAVVTRSEETAFKLIPKRTVVEFSISWWSWFCLLSWILSLIWM
mgnify:CR=1 FL=1